MIKQYSSARKSSFVPRGYLSLEKTIVRLCEVWFYENLMWFYMWANRDHDGRGVETGEHIRFDNLAHETFNRLRGYLYNETLVAEVMRPLNGKREPVPAEYWGSEDADKVIYQGYINDDYNYEVPYSGRVVFKEEDIIRISSAHDDTNIVKEPSGRLAISYFFTKRNLEWEAHEGYIYLDDAYDAFVLYCKDVFGGELEEASQDAKDIMIELLGSGKIHSKRRMLRPVRSNIFIEIHPDGWFQDGRLAKILREIELLPPKTPHLASEDGVPYAYILVSADDIAIYMSHINIEQTKDWELDFDAQGMHAPEPLVEVGHAEDEEDKPSGGAGRPPEFDSDIFFMRAFEVILYNDDIIPDTRTLHAQEAIKRYAEKNNGKGPSGSWAKPHIAKMWNVMGFGKANGDIKDDQ